ncbi:MAG: RNA polymerase sigma factor [Defluviitaleaceae bacterium]|nr:RNA polymerase sigma factor [Defluviitaleaceae bacterium]
MQEQYDKIYRYCYFKVKDSHLAEDLTQEAFLCFFSQSSYISRGKPLAYLYTIARNLCTDAFRKKETCPLPEDLENTDASTDALETSIAVKEALKTLPEDMRELLLLRYANDLSMAEISEITGLSRFAARRKINNALKQLKLVLKKEDFA